MESIRFSKDDCCTAVRQFHFSNISDFVSFHNIANICFLKQIIQEYHFLLIRFS